MLQKAQGLSEHMHYLVSQKRCWPSQCGRFRRWPWGLWMRPCPCGRCCAFPRGTWPAVSDCVTHTQRQRFIRDAFGSNDKVLTSGSLLTPLLWWCQSRRHKPAQGTRSPWLGTWSVWNYISHTQPCHISCNGAVNTHTQTHRLMWLMGVGITTRPSYLSEPQGLCVPHLFNVPEERLLTLLTRVAVQPLRCLHTHKQTHRRLIIIHQYVIMAS